VGCDAVLLGLMSDDSNASAVGPMLAELLGVPSATGVVKEEKTATGFKVERELEGGALEVVELSAPCVLAVQTGLNQVRYASLKGIMAAKKKPIEVKPAALGAPKLTVASLALPPDRKEGRIVGEGPDAVGELVRLLREEAKVL
jgi:electron transfer flavoprotein beta subunit